MKSNSHFVWINFLRGIAAFGVVLYHARVDLWTGWVAISTQPQSFNIFDRAAALLSIPVPFFSYAVMIFFLLSGFCIHYPYVASDRPFKLKQYGIRRFLRIYPPYLAAVVYAVIIEWILRHYFYQDISPVTTVLKTIFMTQNYGSNARQLSSNPSLWSLPVELELYAVYPLFYWLLMRFGIKQAMFVVGVVSLSSLGLLLKNNLFDHNGYQVGNFAIYWIIWCGGALLAEWVKRDQLPKWRPWLWLVMASTFIMAMGVYFLKLFIGLQDLIWGGFYFMVLLWSFTRKNPLQFLNNRMKNIFLSLGLISYSLYLIHYPFFRLCGAMWIDIVGKKPANFLISVFFSILCIPLAYAFYSCFEAPTHRLARKVASRI